MTKFKSEDDVVNEIALMLRVNKQSINLVFKALFQVCVFDLLKQSDDKVMSMIVPYIGKVVMIRNGEGKVETQFVTDATKINNTMEMCGDKDLLAKYCEKLLTQSIFKEEMKDDRRKVS